jgi:phospholipase C
MKSSIQKSLLALSGRAVGFIAVTAILLAPIGSIFANSQRNENNQSPGLERLRHIIVIYQENWSFDSLYGQFPGASGYAYGFDTLPQLDLKASPAYSSLVYKTRHR